jgi:hypothetical protein
MYAARKEIATDQGHLGYVGVKPGSDF